MIYDTIYLFLIIQAEKTKVIQASPRLSITYGSNTLNKSENKKTQYLTATQSHLTASVSQPPSSPASNQLSSQHYHPPRDFLYSNPLHLALAHHHPYHPYSQSYHY